MSFQQVNLLSDDLVPPRQWLTATELLVGVGVFTFLLVAYSGLQVLSLPGLNEVERTARQQLQRMSMTPVTSASTSKINSEIAELREATQRQRAVLDELRGISRHHFSAYLKGLSNARVEGLWFDRIELANDHATTRVGLFGHSLATPKLPELLLALSESEVFGGYQFTDLRVNKDGEIVEFSLFTQAEEAS